MQSVINPLCYCWGMLKWLSHILWICAKTSSMTFSWWLFVLRRHYNHRNDNGTSLLNMMDLNCCLLADQMKEKTKSVSSGFVLTSELSYIRKKEHGYILLRHRKNQYHLRLPVPTVFSEEKGNQGFPTFRVVFKLIEVPSVGREKGNFVLLTQEFAPKCGTHSVKTVLLRVCECVIILTCGGPQLCWRGPLW